MNWTRKSHPSAGENSGRSGGKADCGRNWPGIFTSLSQFGGDVDEKKTASDESLWKTIIHKCIGLWINAEKPVNKGVLSAEAVDNRVENVDEWGKHAVNMHERNHHFMQTKRRMKQYFTKFGEVCLFN